MAWNGRNESILGSKPETEPALIADSSSSPTSEEKADASASAAAKKQPVPAPVPNKSVWNGRHKNIMAHMPKETLPSPESEKLAAAPPKPTKSSQSEPLQIVASPPKDCGISKPKEDEATNSTAGSSTTNTIAEEDPSATADDDAAVLADTVSTGSEKKGQEFGADQQQTKSQELEDSAPTSTVITKKQRPRKNSESSQNTRKNRGKNSISNGYPKNTPRPNGTGSSRRRGNNKNKSLVRQNTPYPSNGSAYVPASKTSMYVPRAAQQQQAHSSYAHTSSYNKHGSNAKYAHSSSVPPFPRKKRAFDPHKARAIQLAKEAQDQEDRSDFASISAIVEEKKSEDGSYPVNDDEGLFYSIDVECIATGHGSCARGINDGCGNEARKLEGTPDNQYNDHSHRYPGRVALVDTDGNLLADVIVRPPKDGEGVVSYLTPLTGLTSEMCLGDDAKSLQDAVKIITDLLPQNAVIVGQAIGHDVQWLGLTPGKDFGRMVDISSVFRQRLPLNLSKASEILKRKESGDLPAKSDSNDTASDEYLGFATKYRHFSLRHVCLNMLGEDIQSGVHDPVVDAKYSLTLFHKYRNASVTQLRILRDGLHRAPITPGFAQEKTPVIDGVCLSALGYPYKRAARKIWRWYSSKRVAKV